MIRAMLISCGGWDCRGKKKTTAQQLVNYSRFFAELKRRNVYKVSVAYAVIAWLLVQVASVLFTAFEAPSWIMQAFVIVIASGFLVALIIAWTFDDSTGDEAD